jgi:RNA ligase
MKDLKNILDALVEEGWVNRQKHPTYDLYIYNYSQKTQFEKNWSKYTMMCRGLVLDSEGNVIAKPFPKFFNEGEHSPDEIPYGENFTVTEKMDGSLGIGFWYNEELVVATRGSFTSDQAVFAKKFLDERIELPHSFHGNYTYLFEIIYKSNRIVCDYQGETRMTLLAVVDNDEDNLELSHEFISRVYDDVFTDVVEQHNITDIKNISSLERDNSEGVVIRFESGFRMKVKWEEYVRLHRIVTGVSNKTVWEYLSNNKPFDELVDRVPDEFYDWVKDTEEALVKKYEDRYSSINILFKNQTITSHPHTRKDYARWVKSQLSLYHGMLFALYDGKNYDGMIWESIKPTFEKPFQTKNILTIK